MLRIAQYLKDQNHPQAICDYLNDNSEFYFDGFWGFARRAIVVAWKLLHDAAAGG